jgi:hypothetical protein
MQKETTARRYVHHNLKWIHASSVCEMIRLGSIPKRYLATRAARPLAPCPIWVTALQMLPDGLNTFETPVPMVGYITHIKLLGPSSGRNRTRFPKRCVPLRMLHKWQVQISSNTVALDTCSYTKCYKNDALWDMKIIQNLVGKLEGKGPTGVDGRKI